MATRPTPAFLFAKWLLVPTGLAAIGYFLIAPHLGEGAAETLRSAGHKLQAKISAPAPSNPPQEDPVTDEPPLTKTAPKPATDAKPAIPATKPEVKPSGDSGPELEISSKPIEAPRRKRRHKPKPAEEAPATPTDDGSNGTVTVDPGATP